MFTLLLRIIGTEQKYLYFAQLEVINENVCTVTLFVILILIIIIATVAETNCSFTQLYYLVLIR